MENKKIFLIILIALIILSIALNVALIILYNKAAGKAAEANNLNQYNAKLLMFRNLFTENIILSEKTVDFETRLKMEEAARDLNDSEIFALWQSFTKSQTSQEVNAGAKNLLNALIKKTKY